MVFRKKLHTQPAAGPTGERPRLHGGDEACAGAHGVARRLAALGHTARLISPQFGETRCAGQQERLQRRAGDLQKRPVGPACASVTPRNEAQQTLSARIGCVKGRRAAACSRHQPDPRLPAGVRYQPAQGAGDHQAPPAVLALHPRSTRASGRAVLERLRARFTCLDKQITEVERELAQQLKEDESSHACWRSPALGQSPPVRPSIETGRCAAVRQQPSICRLLGLVPRQYSTEASQRC